METTTDNPHKIVAGTEVVRLLRKKLHSNEDLFDFKVTQINTLGEWALVFLLFFLHVCLSFEKPCSYQNDTIQ